MELEGIADALKWAVVVLRQPQLHGSSLPPSQPCLCLALKCHRHCLLPFGQWGGWGLVAAGWVLGPRAVASRSTDCVFICPTFCTGSCCQRVNQVDEWPDLRRGNQQSRKRPEQWATLLAGDVPGPTACHHPFSGKCFEDFSLCSDFSAMGFFSGPGFLRY